jgi:hypothetical protein
MNAPLNGLDVNENTKYSRPRGDPGNLVLKNFQGRNLADSHFARRYRLIRLISGR